MQLRRFARKLTWDDFKGIEELNSGYDACLNWGIYYSYTYDKHYDKLNLDLKIHIDVGASSWCRKGKETKDLLNHENGHFLLAHLFGHKFKNEIQQNCDNIDNFSHVTNLELEKYLKFHFDKNFQECVQIQEKYDCQTEHGLNLIQQKRWDEFLEHSINFEKCINFNSFYLF